MAQDPDHSSETGQQPQLDPSHELDMVNIYRSSTVDAEIEADVIRGILESNGVPAMVVTSFGFPPFGFEIRVPRQYEAQARQLISEAQAAGPEAAAEAERQTEQES
jgi:hypothetical protein